MLIPYITIQELPKTYKQAMRGHRKITELAYVSPKFVIDQEAYYIVTITSRFKKAQINKILLMHEDGSIVQDDVLANKLFSMIGLFKYIYDGNQLLALYKEPQNVEEAKNKLDHFNIMLKQDSATVKHKQAIHKMLDNIKEQVTIYKKLQKSAQAAFDEVSKFGDLTMDTVIEEGTKGKLIHQLKPTRGLMHELLLHKINVDDDALATLKDGEDEFLGHEYKDRTFLDRVALEDGKEDIIKNTISFFQACNLWANTSYAETKEEVVNYLQTTDYIDDYIKAYANQYMKKYWRKN